MVTGRRPLIVRVAIRIRSVQPFTSKCNKGLQRIIEKIWRNNGK